LEKVAAEGVDAELLELSIISIISREIKPLYPKEAAMIALRRTLYGITDDFRASRRSWILQTTPEDIRKAAQALLASFDARAVTVVVAGQELLEKEAVTMPRLRIESVKLPV